MFSDIRTVYYIASGSFHRVYERYTIFYLLGGSSSVILILTISLILVSSAIP